MSATGYKTPAAGRTELGARFGTFVRTKKDGLWYSPKDVSGIDRAYNTHAHLRAIKEKHPEAVVKVLDAPEQKAAPKKTAKKKPFTKAESDAAKARDAKIPSTEFRPISQEKTDDQKAVARRQRSAKGEAAKAAKAKKSTPTEIPFTEATVATA